MKRRKISGSIVVICLFWLQLLIPLLLMNTKADVTSPIDNRKLTEFSTVQKDYRHLEKYLKDRLGLRREAILYYTTLHDRLFHEMIHPSYEYGKGEQIFFKTSEIKPFTGYHVDFAEMVAEIQGYCESRGVPFVFVLNPAKVSIQRDELREGIHYNNKWLGRLLMEMEKRGVKYVDNSGLLEAKSRAGEKVFNDQYNVGHWNDLGAFYGVNHVLDYLAKEGLAVRPHSLEEYRIEEKLNTTLPVADFAIYEYEPLFTAKNEAEYRSVDYVNEVALHKQYHHFAYAESEADNDLRALSFQGSYMYGKGHKFLDNAFSETVTVHGYQNILNFDYYFNLFQPDVVIFETAEYTIWDRYYELLNQVRLTGNWEAWLAFFAEAVTVTATQAVESTQSLLSLATENEKRIRSLKRISGSVQMVHNAFLERPLASPIWIQQATKLSPSTVNNCIEKLVDLEILQETTGQKRNRYYVYTAYMDIMNQGTELD